MNRGAAMSVATAVVALRRAAQLAFVNHLDKRSLYRSAKVASLAWQDLSDAVLLLGTKVEFVKHIHIARDGVLRGLSDVTLALHHRDTHPRGNWRALAGRAHDRFADQASRLMQAWPKDVECPIERLETEERDGQLKLLLDQNEKPPEELTVPMRFRFHGITFTREQLEEAATAFMQMREQEQQNTEGKDGGQPT